MFSFFRERGERDGGCDPRTRTQSGGCFCVASPSSYDTVIIIISLTRQISKAASFSPSYSTCWQRAAIWWPRVFNVCALVCVRPCFVVASVRSRAHGQQVGGLLSPPPFGERALLRAALAPQIFLPLFFLHPKTHSAALLLFPCFRTFDSTNVMVTRTRKTKDSVVVGTIYCGTMLQARQEAAAAAAGRQRV